MSSSTIWLRSPRFDAWLQAGALAVIAPALIAYAGLGAQRASVLLPLASLVALPFLHVFGSFFFAFSAERNRSASSPRRLAVQWALWAAAALALQAVAPRALATFALLYGGWHILRQNFGFLRELAARNGRAGDRTLRRLDLLACLAPAVALWLLLAARGPWRFLAFEVYHPSVPRWLVALAFAAVPITIALRQRRFARAAAPGLLLCAGNVAALLAPALLVDDLLLIYTLSATYHGFQYLAYLAARERERAPAEPPIAVLAPLAAAILLSMVGLLVALTLVEWLVAPGRANDALVVVWYAIVPFHYFVDGRIWRARPPAAKRRSPVLALLLAGCGAPAMMPAGPPQPTVTICPGAGAAPMSAGVCQVTAGSSGSLIIGTVLTPGNILRGGQVLIGSDGKIACVGCDCSSMALGASAIDCPAGVISPGLINAHDHITFQGAPAADSGERYEQRNDWRKGQRGHAVLPSGPSATAFQVQLAELRHLMAGATSTVGSGGQPGFLRNLDKAGPLQEGAAHPAADYVTFPLGDSNGTQLDSGCGYPGITPASKVMGDSAYFGHVSEGIDATARNEFLCESSGSNGGQDLTQPQSAFIHAVALEAVDYVLMADEHVSMVWSPRSNVRLYGDTARTPLAARLGVNVALGTDWLPSGSMNMLRELACADAWNAHYGGAFSDEQLWEMATVNAAHAAAFDDVLGTLAVGQWGDVAIFDGRARADHRAILGAQAGDVALVLRAGKPLYGDADVVGALAAGCDALDVCGTPKQACVMSEVGKTLASLMAAAPAGSYPLFSCDPPADEPTCAPSRMTSVNGSSIYGGAAAPGDQDGDGVPDASDNCVGVFNPVRPVDDGKQPDVDGDGVGDACDACPLVPDPKCTREPARAD